MTLLEPHRLYWLLALLPLAAAAGWSAWRGRRGWAAFATTERRAATLPARSRGLGGGRAALLLAAFALLVVAFADPRRGETEREVPPGDAVSVMFALDVSRSMLAEDVSPSRLRRAKEHVREGLRALRALPDAEAGLVAFAGAVRRVSPLTRNFDEIELALDATDVTTAGVGGSNLADAVQTAARSFVARRPGVRAVVLISDGEENVSGEPAAAAKRAFAERGVRFFTVGLGSPTEGATLPLGRGRVVTYRGEPVRSTLQPATLRDIAEAGGGVYLPAETRRLDLSDAWRRVIAPRLRDAAGAAGNAGDRRGERVKTMVPRFGWFAWPALLLLLVERLLAAGAWWRRAAAGRTRRGALAGGASLVVAMFCTSAVADRGPGSPSGAASPAAVYNAAVRAERAGDAAAAADGFAAAALRGRGAVEARARYNLGRLAHAEALRQLAGGGGEVVSNERDGGPADAAAAADPRTLLDRAVREYAAALAADANLDDARLNLEAAARLRERLREPNQNNETVPEPSPDGSSDDASDDPEGTDPPAEPGAGEDDPDAESPADGPNDEAGAEANGGGDDSNASPASGAGTESDADGNGVDGASAGGKPDEATAGTTAGGADDDGSPPPSTPDAGPDPAGGAAGEVDAAGAEEAAGPDGATDDGSVPDVTAGGSAPEPARDAATVPEAVNPAETGDAASPTAATGTEAAAGMTEDEALKLLQQIRDQDLQRRIEQYRREAQRQRRVEQDW